MAIRELEISQQSGEKLQYKSIAYEILDYVAQKRGTTAEVVRGSNGIPPNFKSKIQRDFLRRIGEVGLPLTQEEKGEVLNRDRSVVSHHEKELAKANAIKEKEQAFSGAIAKADSTIPQEPVTELFYYDPSQVVK